MYRCVKCGYITYHKSQYKDDKCIFCREGEVVKDLDLLFKARETEKKSILLLIAMLQVLTAGEGYAGISVWDGGSGGGFSEGSITIHHERSGSNFEHKVDNLPDFRDLIRDAFKPYGASDGFSPSLMRYYKELEEELAFHDSQK